MSGGIAPSKSTVYVGNLPFSLTNNDIHKVLDRYGKIVKVTILKDRDTHKSKGVAFVLFLNRDEASACVQGINKTEMFGRTITCSIAKDNGRTTEFIARKNYPDKTSCYECGECGHLSYACPKNSLGDRDRPVKKKRKPKKSEQDIDYESDDSNAAEDPRLDSLANAISEQQKLHESDITK